MAELTDSDFADLFGTTIDRLPSSRHSFNWKYRRLMGWERDKVILDLLHRIDQKKLSIVSGDKSRWERGWGENLAEFNETGSLEALTPKYFRAGPLRLYGEFIQPEDSNFEANWYMVFREWLTDEHLSAGPVFEFGCGSGFNVAYLAQRFPGTTITGLDWADASVSIMQTLREKGMNVQGRKFDFFRPDNSLDVPPNSIFLTIGALEQTDFNWMHFLHFILEKKPALCVHIEPLVNLYEPEKSLVDYTAWKAHEMRGFWRGFPERLQDLEKTRRLEIIKTKRSYFGSVALEGYSQLMWRPQTSLGT